MNRLQSLCKTIAPWLLMAAVGLLSTACDDETALSEARFLSANIKSINLPSEGATTDITIRSSDSWTLTVPKEADWVYGTFLSGQAGSSIAVSITVAPNFTEDVRSTILTITSEGGVRVEIPVSQEGSPYLLLLNPNPLDLSAAGNGNGTEILVTANAYWIVDEASVCDWVFLSQGGSGQSIEGEGDGSFYAVVSPNMDETARQCSIIVELIVGGLVVKTATLTVNQAGKSFEIGVNPAALNVSAIGIDEDDNGSGTPIAVTVDGYGYWEIENTNDWLVIQSADHSQVDLVQAYGNGSFEVMVQPNASFDARTATLTAKRIEGGVAKRTAAFTVNQAGIPFDVSPNPIVLPAVPNTPVGGFVNATATVTTLPEVQWRVFSPTQFAWASNTPASGFFIGQSSYSLELNAMGNFTGQSISETVLFEIELLGYGPVTLSVPITQPAQ